MRSARVVSSVIRMTLGCCEGLGRGGAFGDEAFGRWAPAGPRASKRNSSKDDAERRTAIEIKKGVYHRQTPWNRDGNRLEHELDCEVHAPRATLGYHWVAHGDVRR